MAQRGIQLDDAELVRRCRDGDEFAWRTLVERYAGLVTGILQGAFRLGAADVEDAFQDVYTRLYLRLDTLRDDRAVAGWIAQVTRNVALDCLRRGGRERAVGEAIGDAGCDVAGYEEPLQAVLEALTVREALAGLPPKQREVLERFFVRDESYATISAALEIPPGTIASRISRALTALRRAVEGHPAAPVPAALTAG